MKVLITNGRYQKTTQGIHRQGSSRTLTAGTAKSPADGGAGVAIAKAAGFSITTEELQSLNNKASELSDDELEDIAGGA